MLFFFIFDSELLFLSARLMNSFSLVYLLYVWHQLFIFKTNYPGRLFTIIGGGMRYGNVRWNKLDSLWKQQFFLPIFYVFISICIMYVCRVCWWTGNIFLFVLKPHDKKVHKESMIELGQSLSILTYVSIFIMKPHTHKILFVDIWVLENKN